jgi:hypothetical protein
MTNVSLCDICPLSVLGMFSRHFCSLCPGVCAHSSMAFHTTCTINMDILNMVLKLRNTFKEAILLSPDSLNPPPSTQTESPPVAFIDISPHDLVSTVDALGPVNKDPSFMPRKVYSLVKDRHSVTLVPKGVVLMGSNLAAWVREMCREDGLGMVFYIATKFRTIRSAVAVIGTCTIVQEDALWPLTIGQLLAAAQDIVAQAWQEVTCDTKLCQLLFTLTTPATAKEVAKLL